MRRGGREQERIPGLRLDRSCALAPTPRPHGIYPAPRGPSRAGETALGSGNGQMRHQMRVEAKICARKENAARAYRWPWDCTCKDSQRRASIRCFATRLLSWRQAARHGLLGHPALQEFSPSLALQQQCCTCEAWRPPWRRRSCGGEPFAHGGTWRKLWTKRTGQFAPPKKAQSLLWCIHRTLAPQLEVEYALKGPGMYHMGTCAR